MKKNILTILVFTTIIIGLPVKAAYVTKLEHKTIQGNSYELKDEAYNYGINKMQELQSMSSFQLSKKIKKNILSTPGLNSLKLTNSYVTVDEFIDSTGMLRYKPNVNISYKFKYRDN
ncbi:DUF3316 domain-containing protein [Aliivibrio sp. S3MY1]|uniref:DUF3316 domain-containing protein n=1 Tax=unclassified Aliivibrio TaxID=2645654 RepID=UPI002379459B|nr:MULTISPECIES: DUF3316 domain-containing protein [unclassified Aliivibrio]MDD9194428.1 DUF3316 domain-containing protein [Aliivibrio sp. S3MY1]MDD9198233.1 DUF3316 domain-containing protein [Aliivibrio sp. S2MY1]